MIPGQGDKMLNNSSDALWVGSGSCEPGEVQNPAQGRTVGNGCHDNPSEG